MTQRKASQERVMTRTPYMEERQQSYKSMREVQGGRVRWNTQMYKPLTQNIQAGCLEWYFDPRIISETSQKLRSLWARPYQVMKLIASAWTEIIPVYYPGEEQLASLDVLKLNRGEDMIWQNPEEEIQIDG